MKLGQYQLLLFHILLSLLIWSCENDDIIDDTTKYNWEVTKIRNHKIPEFLEAKNSYLLEFTSDTTFSLQLDANVCGGRYKLLNNRDVLISIMGCTKVCCDSEFANELLLLLPKMTEYYIDGNKLILKGLGQIILKQN